ncbi:MAG TPA: ankyrin repeat domain-containing protein [Verrucomicrobiae bacterium]|nr:ankyrin repeat domain-containing protein [Verrucomicrobiae bacterium]
MNTPQSKADENSRHLLAFLEAMKAEQKKSPVVQGDPSANPVESLLNLLRLMQHPSPKQTPSKSLGQAALFNNLELVKQFLAFGGNPDEGISGAVARQNLEMLKVLIAAGAKNAGDRIVDAAAGGNMQIIQLLFEAGVDLEKYGADALAKAAYHNHVELVKLLLEKGVPVSAGNYRAVGEAARHCSMEVLRVLFDSGVKPENAGEALRFAAGCPLSFAGVKFLVDAGVDPINHPHYSMRMGEPVDPPYRPADAAAEQNKTEVADFLRGKPIDVEALLAREAERIKYWRSSDDDAIRKEHERKTAHLLRGEKRLEAVQAAVFMARDPALKSSLNNPGVDGQTALGLAATNGDVEIVAALLEAGADPNRPDGKQKPPLYRAASAGHTRVVEKLLQGGADPNAKDDVGYTAIIDAANWDDVEMLKLLLDAGADPKVETKYGVTPMNVGLGLHAKIIKSMLLEAVRKRQGGKPEKGQGLSFVKRKKDFEVGKARGVQAFRDFYYDSHPEWAVAMVRGPIDDVAGAFAGLVKPARVEKDIAKRKISPGSQYQYLFQLKEHPWTIILRSLGRLSLEDMKAIADQARELSRLLKTRAYTYMAENASGAEGYEIFENGESLEEAEKCEHTKFRSNFRSQPKFDDELFPDPMLAEDGIYLPACYPKDSGYDIKLVIEGIQPGDVLRADYVVLGE